MPDAGLSTSPAWLPLFGSLVGFAAGFISEWFRDQRARKREHEGAEAVSAREREARKAARREQLSERRTTFQRETLLALQEAVQRLIRTNGEMHHLDIMAARAGGEWHKQPYPDDLDGRALQANVETTKLGVRVRDESVRVLLQELKEGCVAVMFSPSPDAGEKASHNTTDVFIRLNERIGELLRKMDDDEDPECRDANSPGRSRR